jgi:hypothetical protein
LVVGSEPAPKTTEVPITALTATAAAHVVNVFLCFTKNPFD